MTRRKKNSFGRGVIDIVAGGTTLSVGALVTGSIPGTPAGIAANVQGALRLASVGLPIKGAGLAIGELRKLERLGKRKWRR